MGGASRGLEGGGEDRCSLPAARIGRASASGAGFERGLYNLVKQIAENTEDKRDHRKLLVSPNDPSLFPPRSLFYSVRSMIRVRRRCTLYF